MKYKAHLVGGLLAGAIVLHYSKYSAYSIDGTVTLLSSAFGALLPDIDHEGSYLGHRVKPLSRLISKAVGHRGATHAPMLIIVLFLILHLLTSIHPLLFIGMMTGALSHVFLDAMTISGVPLLYPYNTRKFSFTRMRTGGAGESFSTFVMAIMIVYFIFPK